MARPQKNNADYYPHQTGLRNHRKIKMLRNRFGMVLGYAFWCLMLEWLCEHDGLEWEFSEFEVEMFAAEIGVSAAEIPPMVDFCIKIELLFKSDDNFIYSESLNEYLKPVFEKRNIERQKSKSRQRKGDGTFKTAEISSSGGVSAAEMPHSKEEYSKEEYSREEYTTAKAVVGLDKPTTPVSGVPAKNSFEDRCKKFIEKFNDISQRNFRVTEKVRKSLKARMKTHTANDIIQALKNVMKDKYHMENNFKDLTPEFILREDKLEKYLNVRPIATTNTESTPVVTISHSHRD